ncbi:hypothetical protein [Tautonia plasticadhaerens]|uniref:Uncharacterized protein n=1 Tax=Tautonia plasticadhaerens TaxID=2527974 RepID=A0A518HBY3_9BACT|nr:hypothetical protein [Tautonia plasticadhaerens]QDV38349.1 hypothetical protein ElP_63010 [Tautonia plasticadhaerens]
MADADSRPKSYRMLILLSLLLVILAGVGFSQGILRLPGSYAASVLLINEIPEPINDVVFTYPGGELELARIEPYGSVGSPIYPETGEFEATLAFSIGDGPAIEKSVSARVIGDLLIELIVLPAVERDTVKTEDGQEIEILRASDSQARFVVSYAGERGVDD